MALDYPADRREIVIASDGSTDSTVMRARLYEGRGVSAILASRRGKSAVLNVVVPGLRGDVVLFADARQRFDLERCARWSRISPIRPLAPSAASW